MTVFFTTHYMEEAAAADHVVILEKGAICAEGTPGAFKSRYGKDTLKLRFVDLSGGVERLISGNVDSRYRFRLDIYGSKYICDETLQEKLIFSET